MEHAHALSDAHGLVEPVAPQLGQAKQKPLPEQGVSVIELVYTHGKEAAGQARPLPLPAGLAHGG
jgi:hypothetical protein